MIQFLLPLRFWLKNRGYSQRYLAKRSGQSRGVIRAFIDRNKNITLNSIERITRSLDGQATLLLTTDEGDVNYSSIATALKIGKDGLDSWKIHLMDYVDEFLKTADPILIVVPPPKDTDSRIKALMASVTEQLCLDMEMEVPMWAQKRYFLETPWFVSGMQSLKASSIVESPLPFRKNNIFVHDNFLVRI